MDTSAEAAAPKSVERAASSRVVLKLHASETGGIFLTGEGHIVCSLHAVSGEGQITALTTHGYELPVTGVIATDPRRDIAILKVDGFGFPKAHLAQPAAVSEGDLVYAFRHFRGVETSPLRVSVVHVLGPNLELFELEGSLLGESNGSPVFNAAGEAVGFVTAGRGATGPKTPTGTTVGTPLKHVLPLITEGPLRPLSLLTALSERNNIRREVPNHPLEMLNGANQAALQQVAKALGRAIAQGAPLYNSGDIAGCATLYESVARKLCETSGAAGIVAALRVGLTRAGTVETADQKAWALRDTFDGILGVIHRYFVAHAVGKAAPLTTLLN